MFNERWTNYGQSVQYRAHAASKAAKYDAVAVLIRSVTPFSINSPHTGWQYYETDVKKIPTACITVEDAELLQRFQDRGKGRYIFLFVFHENDLLYSRNPDEIEANDGCSELSRCHCS